MIKYILCCFLIVNSLKNSAQTLHFISNSNSWEEILQKAQKIDKPIFVDVYTEWCGPCKWMDQNVFNEKTVVSFFESNFLSVKIDAEKGYGPAFSKENLVGGYPTLLFFSPEGELIMSGIGSLKSEILIQSGKQALENLKKGVSLPKLTSNTEKWNMNSTETMEYIKKMSIERKPNGVLIEYYLNAITTDSLYTPQVFKMITSGHYTRFPLNGKVFQVLLYHYKKYPVKSGELMSTWNTIRNNLKNFADSAGTQKDTAWLSEILKESDSLNDDLEVRRRERNYFQTLYYSGARDALNFIKTAKLFGENSIMNAHESVLHNMDSILFNKSLLVKFGTGINEKTLQSNEFKIHKRVFMPKTKIILDEMLDIYYYLQYRFPQDFELNKSVFKIYIKRALEFYQGNPVRVSQPFIDDVNKLVFNIR